MKLNINTIDGTGYTVIFNEFESLKEAIEYIDTHKYLVGRLSNTNKPIIIASDKIATVVG